MRHLALTLVLGLASPLAAQVIAYSGPSPTPIGEGRRLEWTVRSTPHGALVVVDDPEAKLSKLLQDVLRSEELEDLELGLHILSGNSLAELRTRFGWAEGPRWAFLGRDFTVRVGTTGPFSADGLRQALLALRIPNPLKLMTTFVQAHPDRPDALVALFDLQARKASRSMAPFLKPLDSGATSDLFTLGDGMPVRIARPRERLKPLSEAEDARIWGDAARTLVALFRHPAWQLAARGTTPPSGAEFSPLMQAAARRILGEVEAEVARHPHDEDVWRTFVAVARCAGNRPLPPFLRTLEALPGRSLPPASSVPHLVESLRKEQAWSDLRDLLLPLVREAQGGDNSVRFVGNWGTRDDFFKGIWRQSLSPLLEALLRLKDLDTAEEILQTASRQHGTTHFPTWASQLALACGQRDLALRWAALRIEAKDREEESSHK